MRYCSLVWSLEWLPHTRPLQTLLSTGLPFHAMLILIKLVLDEGGLLTLNTKSWKNADAATGDICMCGQLCLVLYYVMLNNDWYDCYCLHSS